ncbi:MAG: hypothetical protein J5817_11480, partial [Treponema sp.]|nr:hypothetical protein [Treponema sp.]
FEFAGDDDNVSKENVETVKISGITDSSILIDGQEYVSSCNYAVLGNEEYFKDQKNGQQYNSYIKGFMQAFYTSQELFYSVYSRDKTYYDDQFIRYGVYNPQNSAYMEKYFDYWTPIMNEHQKKADEIK